MIDTGNFQSVRQFHVKNQFIIETDQGLMFMSYNSNIVFKGNDGKTYLDKRFWNYSKTTGKYRNLFLMEDKRETEKKIKSGEYVFTNLN